MFNNGLLTSTTTDIGGLAYLQHRLDTYVPYLVFYTTGVIVGILGNTLIMGAIIVTKGIKNPTNILVFNLAVADIFISGFVDSTSIIGVFIGKRMFDFAPYLCDFVASVCLIACTTSMVSIGFLSINRYINICYNSHYNKIFTIRKTIVYCCITWFIGICIDLPLFFGWGQHTYDIDTLSCIWDRRASHSYALFFPLTVIVIPCCLIAFCYSRIFVYVRRAKLKIANSTQEKTAKDRAKSINFAKGLFGSFLIFTICWLPYGTVVMSDWNSEPFPKEAALYTVMLAHLNSAFNPILYGVYNTTYRKGYWQFLRKIFHVKKYITADTITKTNDTQINLARFKTATANKRY